MEESEYIEGLDEPVRSRYCQKIEMRIGCDPYKTKKSNCSHNLTDLPSVEAINITNCLLLQTSCDTASQMKAYKILEAYNYFVCGWGRNLGTKVALNCRLVFAQISNCA